MDASPCFSLHVFLMFDLFFFFLQLSVNCELYSLVDWCACVRFLIKWIVFLVLFKCVDSVDSCAVVFDYKIMENIIVVIVTKTTSQFAKHSLSQRFNASMFKVSHFFIYLLFNGLLNVSNVFKSCFITF